MFSLLETDASLFEFFFPPMVCCRGIVFIFIYKPTHKLHINMKETVVVSLQAAGHFLCE